MLQLYYDRGCPFCQRVLAFLDSEGIEFERKEFSLRSDSPIRQELIEKGGRAQVPFLVDVDRNRTMYESADIIDYVREHYAD